MPLRDDQHTWQFEHLGFLIICKACWQVQVSIPSVLHHISTVEVAVCEPDFIPGFMQVPKHLHEKIPVYQEAVQEDAQRQHGLQLQCTLMLCVYTKPTKVG